MSNILKQRLAAGQSISIDHPAADVLSAFVERRLKEPERERVLGHLASCSECREAVALAASEVEVQQSAVPARGMMLRFPAAIRWASVAAMVAVAVGIGVISVDRESTRHGITALPAAVSNSAQKTAEASDAGTPGVQNGPVVQNQITPTGRDQKLEEAKKTPSAEARKKQMSGVARAKVEDLNLNSRSVSNAVAAETPGVRGGLIAQPEAQGNAFVAAAPLSSSQNGNGDKNVAPFAPPPSVSPSVTVAASSDAIQTSDAGERVMAKTKNAPQSANQTVEVMAQAPVVPVEGFVPPDSSKTSGGLALGGAMRRSSVAVTELVSWTVTTAGKLQRRLRDGAVKMIEPAPGVIVRAVAAHGIEVWAGGSQPDLTARQWRQAPALFHSSDAGETWRKVNGPWHGPINRLALLDSETLTVVTDDGTWTSRDAGSSWSTQ